MDTADILAKDEVFASAISCGIKQNILDLAYIYLPGCRSSAGVFTKNAFAAPCIAHNRAALAHGPIKAIIVNSGNANACNGDTGRAAVAATAKFAAELLGIKPEEVGIASTGIIGKPLPMDKIERGLQELLREPQQREWRKTAEAIRTTDTYAKLAYASRPFADQHFEATGIAKGSGMIAPNMATMLAFIVINADIPQTLLQPMLAEVVEDTFNCVSVDTDTSTNDMVLVLSTGSAKLDSGDRAALDAVQQVLSDCSATLARELVRDGEGASKIIEVHVQGALDKEQARQIAKSVAESPLVKTAIHGEDPNWGRVLMAAGKTPKVTIDPEKVSLFFGDLQIVENGQPLDYPRERFIPALKGKEVIITLDMGLGDASANALGCDLTHAYIDINTHYS